MKALLLSAVALLCVFTEVSFAQDVDHPLKIKDGVAPPKLVKQVDPEISRWMAKQDVQPVVLVHIVVDEKGHVATLRLDKPGIPEFDQPALDAIGRWKFEPAKLDGKPVAVELNVEMSFDMKRKKK